MHLTDAHCHADFSEFADFEGLAFGLDLCVCACFPGDWQGLKKFNAFPVKKSYGIHPDLRVSEFDNIEFVERAVFETLLPTLQQYLISADAIGETGLDENIERRVPMEVQKRIFAAQLSLAEKFNLPAVIHCAGAAGAVYAMLKDWSAKSSLSLEERLGGKKVRRFLMHAAKFSPELVREFEKIGGYFSFGLREINSERGAKCAASASSDRIMVETDAGASRKIISETVDVLAKIRNADPIELSETLYKNFMYFYSK